MRRIFDTDADVDLGWLRILYCIFGSSALVALKLWRALFIKRADALVTVFGRY